MSVPLNTNAIITVDLSSISSISDDVQFVGVELSAL